jgi:hypothetical protein
MAHLKALTKELEAATSLTIEMHKGHTFIHKLKLAIDGILNANKREVQRVSMPNEAAPPAMTSVELPIKKKYRGATHYEGAGPDSKKEFNQHKTHASTPDA